MDLTLTEEHRQIRRAARELAEEEFAEDAFTWHEEYPAENARILAEHGYLGMTLPEEYGGGGMGFFDALMALEGIGEVCPDTALLLVTTNTGNMQIVAKFAEEEYAREYLEPVCAGENTYVAIAMSEPGAGSAVTDMATTAEDDGDAWVVDGQKAWVSRAGKSSAFVTYVRLPDGNIGSVLVDSDNPGLEVGDPDYNMYDEPQYSIYLDDCRVDKSRSLVTGPESFKEQIRTYNVNRVMGMAGNWVIAKWLFDDALEYAQHREQGGNPIADYQAVSHRLTDMAINLETSRWLIYRALSGDELPGRALSCMTKVHAAEKLHEVVDDALQIKAANGFVGDTPESYAYRRLRGYLIAGGTPDIHRNNVAKSLLKHGYPEVE
ncbi:MAG: acyl-CoA dehydrogenase family protein [Haloarculaceae archaeon]